MIPFPYRAALAPALVVAALLASPLWLEELSPYIEEPEEEALFPDEFYSLASEAQEIYSAMYETDRQMAVDFVAARLTTPEPLDEPNLPLIDPDPAGVTMLLTGSFVTLDPVRGALGTASLYRLSDGRRLLRLENFEAGGGAEAHFLLRAYPDPATQSDLDQILQYPIDLGPLKSGAGSQNPTSRPRRASVQSSNSVMAAPESSGTSADQERMTCVWSPTCSSVRGLPSASTTRRST